MNSYYGPQHSHYGYPNAQYAPQHQYAPQPVAPKNSGSGMQMAAGALALLAIGIGAFAVMFSMKHNSGMENTAAQSAPSTVINLPSEINVPSLGSSTPSAPVVVNSPAPRVITVPGQAPAQAPAQNPAPAQNQAPVQNQSPAQNSADEQKKADAQAKAAQQTASLRAAAQAQRNQATVLRSQAGLNPGLLGEADRLDANAKSLEDQADALGG